MFYNVGDGGYKAGAISANPPIDLIQYGIISFERCRRGVYIYMANPEGMKTNFTALDLNEMIGRVRQAVRRRFLAHLIERGYYNGISSNHTEPGDTPAHPRCVENAKRFAATSTNGFVGRITRLVS